MWKVEYENDTGYNDEGFWEWWEVTNGETSFRCKEEEDANWLAEQLNKIKRS